VEDSFDLVIKEHLALQRRNRLLEADMPIERYREPGSTPARVLSSSVLEDTQEWVLPEVSTVIEHEPLFPPPEELWTGTPAFDWGD
jgi:hypothetical protein